MSTVLVSGWYGNGNLGDEALLAGMLHALEAADATVEPVVMSDAPDRTARLHGVRARGRSSAGHRRRLLSELPSLLGHDALAIGGGGLIKDFGTSPGNVHAWLRPGLIARRVGKPCMWYAMGVDDVRFEESRAVIRRAAAAAGVITVRDDGSRRVLREIGVTQPLLTTADPAVLVAQPSSAWPAGDRPTVAVCPRHWKSRGPDVDEPQLEERMRTELAAALDELVDAHGARILMLPFRSAPGDDDAEVCRDLAGRMRLAEAVSVADVPSRPADAARALAGCRLVVGTRLHSLILAAGAGVPFFGLDYMPKVRFFADRAGMGALHATLEAAAEPGHLTERLSDALSGAEALRERLLVTSGLLRRLALADGRLLAALANGDGTREVVADVRDHNHALDAARLAGRPDRASEVPG